MVCKTHQKLNIILGEWLSGKDFVGSRGKIKKAKKRKDPKGRLKMRK